MALRNGPVAKPVPLAGPPIPLTEPDLARLREPRFVVTPLAKLRDSHHMIARLSATGLGNKEVAERVGYSRERVSLLLQTPAMAELVANYRAKIDEAFVANVDSFFELATRNMIAAERHIADHIAELDENGELLPVRTALAISRDGADRFGYGKKSQNLNINLDFASQLEKAIHRSGKTIDSVTVPTKPASVPNIPHSSHPTRSSVEQSRPLIRRRA